EPVGAVAQGHFLAARRIDAEDARLVEIGAGSRVRLGIDDAQLAGEAAGRIVGAADEGAKLAQLQPQPAVAAGRALARALATPLAAVVVGRKEMGPELLVELVEHL